MTAERTGLIAITALALGATLASSAHAQSTWSSPGFDPGKAAQLAQTLVQHQAIVLRSRGATAGVIDAQGEMWLGGSGKRDGTAAMLHSTRTAYGSISKTFTAALVLELRDQQLLSLDDTLSQYNVGLLPHGAGWGYPNASRVTIRQMLSMSSGLPVTVDDLGFIFSYLTSSAGLTGMWRYTLERVIAMTNREPSLAPPGTTFRYNNTNYVLLALIVEEVTGKPFAVALRDEILEPAGLETTSVLHGPDPSYAVGYNWVGAERTGSTGPWPVGASGIVAPTRDVLTFFRKLFKGQVISPASVAEMVTPVIEDSPGSGTGYALGIVVLRGSSGELIYVHTGGVAGFEATAAYIPSVDLTIVSNLNLENGDPTHSLPLSMGSIMAQP